MATTVKFICTTPGCGTIVQPSEATKPCPKCGKQSYKLHVENPASKPTEPESKKETASVAPEPAKSNAAAPAEPVTRVNRQTRDTTGLVTGCLGSVTKVLFNRFTLTFIFGTVGILILVQLFRTFGNVQRGVNFLQAFGTSNWIDTSYFQSGLSMDAFVILLGLGFPLFIFPNTIIDMLKNINNRVDVSGLLGLLTVILSILAPTPLLKLALMTVALIAMNGNIFAKTSSTFFLALIAVFALLYAVGISYPSWNPNDLKGAVRIIQSVLRVVYTLNEGWFAIITYIPIIIANIFTLRPDVDSSPMILLHVTLAGLSIAFGRVPFTIIEGNYQYFDSFAQFSKAMNASWPYWLMLSGNLLWTLILCITESLKDTELIKEKGFKEVYSEEKKSTEIKEVELEREVWKRSSFRRIPLPIAYMLLTTIIAVAFKNWLGGTIFMWIIIWFAGIGIIPGIVLEILIQKPTIRDQLTIWITELVGDFAILLRCIFWPNGVYELYMTILMILCTFIKPVSIALGILTIPS